MTTMSDMAVRPHADNVHRCPHKGSGPTPCCGRSPFELPAGSRITDDAEQVTCRIAHTED